MGRLSCRCLNVSVHYTDGAWNRRPVEASQLLPAGSADKIAQETLYELDLDVAGVTMVSERGEESGGEGLLVAVCTRVCVSLYLCASACVRAGAYARACEIRPTCCWQDSPLSVCQVLL